MKPLELRRMTPFARVCRQDFLSAQAGKPNEPPTNKTRLMGKTSLSGTFYDVNTGHWVIDPPPSAKLKGAKR